MPTGVVLLFIEGVGLALVLAYIAAVRPPPADGDHAAVSVAAGLAGGLGLFLFYRALAIGTMSIVAPISACGVVIPVVVGLAGGESLSALTAAGMALAFAGVLLASREGPSEDDSERRGGRLSIALALVSAVGFGTFFTLSDIAAETSVPWLLLLARVVICVALVAWATAARPALPAARDAWPLVLAGAMDVGATALYGVALREGELSVVSVVGSLYPVVTVLLARALLAERVRGLQATGVLGAFCGVVLIVAGG